MDGSITQYIKIVVGLFVIVNPIGMAPIFLSLTQDQSEQEKRATARIAAVAATALLVGAALTGEHILSFFGVSIPSFRVAGGLLVLLVSLAMLHARESGAKHTPEEAAEAADKENVAVVPLAIPLLAGPAALSTAILYAHQAKSAFDVAFVIGACMLVGLCVYVAFRIAAPMSRLLGKTGTNIMTRLFGILLAAIGVEFIARGLAQLLPGLAH